MMVLEKRPWMAILVGWATFLLLHLGLFCALLLCHVCGAPKVIRDILFLVMDGIGMIGGIALVTLGTWDMCKRFKSIVASVLVCLIAVPVQAAVWVGLWILFQIPLLILISGETI